MLDTNVADFASRRGAWSDVGILQLFAMGHIAGYALGGCWTHIGCALAYAFIHRDVVEHHTPIRWIGEMTPVIVMTNGRTLTALIYCGSALLRWL